MVRPHSVVVTNRPEVELNRNKTKFDKRWIVGLVRKIFTFGNIFRIEVSEDRMSFIFFFFSLVTVKCFLFIVSDERFDFVLYVGQLYTHLQNEYSGTNTSDSKPMYNV